MRDFDKIYSEYFSAVYKFVLRLCKNASLAEEITEEAFFKALKSIDTYDERYRLGTWLCQIAKNTYYSYLQKQNRQTELLPDAAASDENLEERFADSETAFAVHKVLHALKEPYRAVFTLRIFGELSYAQIGLLFGKTESWARVTFHRAKIMIREELE